MFGLRYAKGQVRPCRGTAWRKYELARYEPLGLGRGCLSRSGWSQDKLKGEQERQTVEGLLAQRSVCTALILPIRLTFGPLTSSLETDLWPRYSRGAPD